MPKGRAFINRLTNKAILRKKYPYGGPAKLTDLGRNPKKWIVVGFKKIIAPSGGIINVPESRLKRIKPGTGTGPGGGRRGRHRGHLKKNKK